MFGITRCEYGIWENQCGTKHALKFAKITVAHCDSDKLGANTNMHLSMNGYGA
jgi:hypothetical protein